MKVIKLNEKIMAREMGDASKVAVAGGDGSNLFYFYTGSSLYKDNSVENIAAFAQKRFDSCKDKSVDEIASKHIFWGTEGPSFNGFYNGDTYVLFDDIQKLPEDVKKDAYTNCKGYRDSNQKFKESLNEKLIPVSQDILDEFEKVLAKNGWDIEGKGKTWMGNIHYQIICDCHPIHPEDLRQLATPLINDIHSFEEENNIPITWNFGLNKDSIPTAGVTLDSQWVPDDVNESLLKESYGDGWSEDIKDLLENLVDELYHFSYEIQSCVRGAYTNCDTSEELGDYMISLSELIASLGESVKELPSAEDYGDDEDLDESLNSSSINDIEPINK